MDCKQLPMLLMSLQEECWSKRELDLAVTQRVAESLQSLKARLEGVAVAEVCAEGAPCTRDDSAVLMPLIEEQMDGLQHSWTRQSYFQRVQNPLSQILLVTS